MFVLFPVLSRVINLLVVIFNFSNMLKGLFGGWTGWRTATSDDRDARINATTGLCFASEKATPVVLQSSFECLPHFYCPNANASNPLSMPSMCPPTIECQKMRLFSEFCPPQGIYEPQVCPRGFYW